MRELVASIVSVIAGAVIGWAAQALTLVGRLEAVEHQLSDIKTDLRTLIQKDHHEQEKTPPAPQRQGPFPSSQVR